MNKKVNCGYTRKPKHDKAKMKRMSRNNQQWNNVYTKVQENLSTARRIAWLTGCWARGAYSLQADPCDDPSDVTNVARSNVAQTLPEISGATSPQHTGDNKPHTLSQTTCLREQMPTMLQLKIH